MYKTYQLTHSESFRFKTMYIEFRNKIETDTREFVQLHLLTKMKPSNPRDHTFPVLWIWIESFEHIKGLSRVVELSGDVAVCGDHGENRESPAEKTKLRYHSTFNYWSV